jgi:hypothetical protein
MEQNKKVIDAAEQICTCKDCIESRMRNERSKCDKNKLLSYLPMKIIKPNPGNKFKPKALNYSQVKKKGTVYWRYPA